MSDLYLYLGVELGTLLAMAIFVAWKQTRPDAE